MIKIVNDLIPLKGYTAMTLWPFVFVRSGSLARYTARTDRHEHIHACQQRELLWVVFLLWYGLEWIIRLAILRNRNKAYRAISFEQEAYAHDGAPGYLDERRWYAWVPYIFRCPK